MSNHVLWCLMLGVLGGVMSGLVWPDYRNRVDQAARRDRRRRLVAGMVEAGAVRRAA